MTGIRDGAHEWIGPPAGVGLASYAKPVLEKAEGVLEACLETCPCEGEFDRVRLDQARAAELLEKRGLSCKEIDLWLVLHERTRFAREFLENSVGKPWVARDYQVESLESYALRKVHCDGRDVGKTSEIEIVAAWAMVTRPNTEMLIATQCENHLVPLMYRLVRRFQTSPYLAPDLVELKRSPSWFMRFSNGFTLWGRIAGPHGMNFQGMHVDWQIVDEAQEMTENSWAELFQALNSEGRRWVYGVPNGLRNTFYRLTEMQDVEQYNWPSSLNPGFTAEKDAELVRLYGGRNSPGYITRVLGQHGAPAHGVFHLDDYLACVDEELEFTNLVLGEEDPFEAPEGVPEGTYYLGCDLGYARDPSEFVVYRADPPHLINVARIHLYGVNYARQTRIIEQLDDVYGFSNIGIDCGNNGQAVSHELMARGDVWCDKVRAFDFGSALKLAPFPDGSPQRRQAKEFMTELLLRRLAEKTIVFPPLPDREMQYASHTYSVGAKGQIVYEKGDDHIIDADRCALLAHYLDTEEDRAVVDLGMRVETF
jgi:hypothetical protein